MDVLQLTAAARDLSVATLLVAAIVGGWKGLYVWRWYYDERMSAIITERDEWKEIAKRGLGTAEKALTKG